MSNKKYSPGKFAIGLCDRCGWRYFLHELKFESIAAKGAPEDKPSGLRVCPPCLDPPHPQAFLPQAVKAKLPDAQALYQPRPDLFPDTFAVGFVLPGAIYGPIDLTDDSGLKDTGIPLPQGFNGLLIGVGTFLPLNLQASTVDPLSVSNAAFASSQQVRLTLTIPSDCPIGMYPVTFSTQAPGGLTSIISGLINVQLPS